MRPAPASVAAVAGLFALLAPTSATGRGDVVTLGRNGAWEAYAARSSANEPMCGMSVRGADGRSLHIKWFHGRPGFVVHAFGAGWRIPEGTRLRVRKSIDGGEPWIVREALGHRDMVQWLVRGDELRPFLARFRQGLRMTVSFPDGDETPWVASLVGSSVTSDLFLRCVGVVLDAQGGGTQPHGRSAAGAPSGVGTQPFGGGSAPLREPTAPLPVGPSTRL